MAPMEPNNRNHGSSIIPPPSSDPRNEAIDLAPSQADVQAQDSPGHSWGQIASIRRSSADATAGLPRAATFPRSSRRRSLAADSNAALGHEQHVLSPILSRVPMADIAPGPAASGDRHGAEGERGGGTPEKAHVLATAASIPNYAGSNTGKSFRQSRSSKSREKEGFVRKHWKSAGWEEGAKTRVAAAYERLIIKGLLGHRTLSPSLHGRNIPLNPPAILVDERSQKPHISNFIRSSRYNVYNFVPKQLLFQFSKLGNFYFLVMGTLQMIPGLSTVGRWTTIVPLSIFVAFSMAKEGYDDFRRYQLDKAENRSLTWVLRRGRDEGSNSGNSEGKRVWDFKKDIDLEGGVYATMENGDSEWTLKQWQDVKVGDVIRLKRNDAVPADMVLLHATGPNGVAYIETMALDGETNLKSKQACSLLAEQCSTVEGIKSSPAVIVSEDPNIDLYSYDGKVTVGGETLPLSLNNIAYRGSIVRNTAEVFGLVVNSGEECKIRMNANKNVTAKKPAMHAIINKMVLFQIVIVLMLAAGFTIGYHIWKREVQSRSFYLVSSVRWSASVPFRDIFFGYLLMFNTLIPLSLYISMEIIKIGQLILLQDVAMYDPVSNTPMVANTTTILENLGQVSYVFSDKTGTLTENVMRFRKMSVAGVACLHDMDVQRDEKVKQRKIEASMLSRRKPDSRAETHNSSFLMKSTEHDTYTDDGYDDEDSAPTKRKGSFASASHWRSSVRPHEQPELKTEDMLDYIRRKPNTVFSRRAKHFLLCIALCHTCLPEQQEDGELAFQAASPDELALVEAARDMGWLLIDRPGQIIKLRSTDENGFLQIEEYQVLDVIEFSSKRKRMSIIIRMPDGRICVFCKGADNVIVSRLRMGHLAEQKFKDIGRRASVRKTFEQDKARNRMSLASVMDTPRNSTAIKRGDSIDALEGLRRSIGRRSTDLNRLSLHEGFSTRMTRQQPDEQAMPRGSFEPHNQPRNSVGRRQALDTIDQRIDESVAANDAAVFEQCFQHVDDFASEGLRTLLYAYRYVDEDMYADWKQLYREAETSLVNRQERVEEAGEMIEQKLELAGATAIEDKLQEGVPETIDKLRRANVKVWMLTGDKRETAINIGHSARVCKPYSEVYIIDRHNGDLRDTLQTTLNDVGRGLVPHSVLVVDGQTLAMIDADASLASLFYDLALRVDSVICCRASPSQKADLVTSVRRSLPSSMTLAIGDGANDIGMIQSSHVGIGISGREGLQAARISDYSIAQFRFLQQLLFVHGRWNYLRTGKYVLATFWKEIIFFLAQAHFQRFNGYSGTSLFESTSLTVFNSLFTSLPVVMLGIFEKDLSAETLLAVPELYTFGQQNRGFNLLQYVGWMLMGVTGSFVIYYFTWANYAMAISSLQDTDLYAMGTLCFTVGVSFINVKLL